jgi:hypothetical protein
MLVSDAQREVRTVYLGGSVGQLVSALVWLASASAGTLASPVVGFWALALGGATIFPLTQAALRLAGRPATLSAGNPCRGLAIQVAFTVPLALPVAAAAALHRAGWFYPACLVVVGAHYLPFVFLYGMRTFAALAAALIGAGYAIGLLAPNEVVLGGWAGGLILLVSAAGLLAAYRKGQDRSATSD